MTALRAVRRLTRRVARAYHLVCARDDVRLRGLSVPAGVWACQACRLISFDQATHRRHVATVH